MKPTRSLLLFAGSLAALCFSYTAQAADLTWDNGGGTGNWNTLDSNFTGSPWSNSGNTAVFGGAPGSTITISEAAISATGVTFNVNNDIIAATGTNNLTLASPAKITVNDGLAATISAPLAGSAAFALESNSVGGAVGSGGTLTTSGVSTITAGGFTVGGASSGNTWNLSGGGTVASGTGIRKIYIGSVNEASGLATTGNNRVFISTPGSVVSPSFNVSGNGGRVTIGYASSGNSMTVNNGAYVAQTTGGGTNTWEMGVLSGANNNTMTVTGTNSSVVFGSNQFLNVGVAGNGNSTVVSAGGFLKVGRLGAGTAGGKNNFIQVTGTGSIVTVNTSSQPIFQIGLTTGSTGNYVKVDSGGAFTATGGFNRGYVVGAVAGADNNYILVTGSGSSFTMQEGMPLSFGGTAGVNNANHTITDSTASGNHFDVYSGASTVQNSLYIMGANSAFNLGDGTGISQATVNNSTGNAIYGPGVTLYGAGTTMNFKSGRLIAGVTGNLVSGAGKVNLLGAAYISTALGNINTISTEITGAGSLTKEGAGTLDLTYLNTYTGDTIVTGTGGILKMENAYLADTAAVRLFTGGKLDLNTGATDTIAAFYIDGVSQGSGTWDSGNLPSFITGSGKLFVAAIPEPAAALLGGLGLLSLLRRRRNA